MKRKRALALLAVMTAAALFCLLPPAGASGGSDPDEIITEEILPGEDWEPGTHEEPETAAEPEEPENPARTAFIDDIIALGEKLYRQAKGKLQRAQYKQDIYICKNFTVYLFRQTRDRYRMAEYPDTQLKIPDNLPSDKCKPYYYGYCWKDVSAEEGNPFIIVDQFLYDTSLTPAENKEKAIALMRQVRRGDFFQMTADYSHGKGAHSAIMIADYDPETDTVHWMDSNMAGKKINGIRYGMVQFDAEASAEWWASAFCVRKRGATLYRLREDIIFSDP